MRIEQRAEHVKMALAEAGYPTADVTAVGDKQVWTRFTTTDGSVIPRRVLWMAYKLSGPVRCWKCWDARPAQAKSVCLSIGAGVENCGLHS